MESSSDECVGGFDSSMLGGLVGDEVGDWRWFRGVGSRMGLGWELLACGVGSEWAGNSSVAWVGMEGRLIGVWGWDSGVGVSRVSPGGGGWVTGGGGGWVPGGGGSWVTGGGGGRVTGWAGGRVTGWAGGRFTHGGVGVSFFLKNISLDEYNMLSGTRIGGRFSVVYRWLRYWT